MILSNSDNRYYYYCDYRKNNKITKKNNNENNNNKNYRNTTNNKKYKCHHTVPKIILINFILLLEIVHVGSNSFVLSKCRQTCETYSEESPQEKSTLCDTACKASQCEDGCNLYTKALHSSCHELCFKDPNLQKEAWATLSMEEKSCSTGCSKALDLYIEMKTAELKKATLHAPEVERDSVTNSSVYLQWKTQELVPNISYTVQMKMPDISNDWQPCNSTNLIKEHVIKFNVHNLRPYTTYKFKIVAFIKNPDIFLESNASVSVTTLPSGKPSSPPKILSVTTPSPTVITVIWNSPLFPNSQLLGYKLMVIDAKRKVLREVSPNTLSWTFNQLQPLHTYTIKVSAWNSGGEGPADTLEITTPERTQENDTETPYLVLAASNMVLKHSLIDVFGDPITLHQSHNRSILVLGPEVLCESKSGLIQGIGVHIKEKIVLFSDSEGKVHLVYTNSSNEVKKNIYPSLVHPKSISIDWLDNKAYIAGDDKIFQCLLPHDYNCTVFLDGLKSRPKDIHVDPINGYLFYVQTEKPSGIFQVDLGEHSKRQPKLIVANYQQSFTIDFQNIQLYFPNDTVNTVMSSFLDGKELSNIRPNVVKPNFHAIKSMVFFNGSFYWTDGDKVLHEVYDRHGKKYHHNKIHFEENHFGGFNLLHPSAQPTPAPVSAPDKLEVLFSDIKAFIQWESPKRLVYQSMGFWKGWKYEVMIKEAEQKAETIQVSGFNFTKDKLNPNTQYTIKVRAYINNTHGPWTENFVGHTLHKEYTSSIITYSTSDGNVYQIQTDGQNEKFIRKFQMSFDFKHMHISMVPYEHVLRFEQQNYSAKSIAMDWLAKKIYWSTSKIRGEIRWASMDNYKKSELLSIAPARDLCIDALKGILYWNTKDSIQASYLNGMHITQYQPMSFTRRIIAMTLDMDSHSIYWVQNDMSSPELHKADMIGYGNPYVNSSIKFVASQRRFLRTQIQYYSNHLFWINDRSQLVVSDMWAQNISRISKANNKILSFSLFHPSMHKYPEGLNESTVKVVPDKIPPVSVIVEGTWSVFKLSWRKAVEINYGEVYYQMNLIVEEFKQYNKTLDLQTPEYTISKMPPYTAMTISLQALTYYGASEWTTLKIHSPMSVPNEPINPRVYINERKDLSSSNAFLSADLRWSAPSNRFGVLEKYNVYYRTSKFPPGVWNMSKVDPDTRQFVLEHLSINETYTFQTEACTIHNCSKKSEKVSITSNNTKPLPELLVADNHGISLAELDNGLNFSQKVIQIPTKAFTFLAKTNFFFWVKNDTNLVMHDGKEKEINLMHLKEAIKDLTVDWIDHTIYLSTEKEIQKYNIYKKKPRLLRSGGGNIGSIAVSPYSSALYWSEEQNNGIHKIFRSNTDGSEMRQLLPTLEHHPQKRSTSQQKCQCPKDLAIAGTIGLDYSNENIYFMELKNKSIWRVDDKGCQCMRVFTPNSPEKVHVPNSLTADHSRVYWSNQRDGKIYSANKLTGKDFLTYDVNNVKKIVAYGSHLQPLPESKCLSSNPEPTNITLLKTTNTSVTLLLPNITRYPECEKVSQPVTNYTIHYSELKDNSEDISCTKKTVNCHTQDTYTRETVISSLKPYTKYVFQVAVSNFYTDYRADVLGTPLVTRTLAGVPSAVRNVGAYCLSYEDILLTWNPPLEPNGNISTLVYMVTYSMTLSTGEMLEKTIQLVHHKIYKRKSMRLEYTLDKLKPNHEYKIKVKSCESTKKWCSFSLDAHNRTIMYPSPIELINATSDTLIISWRTPSDISILRFMFFSKESGKNWTPALNLYEGLQPKMNQTVEQTFQSLKSDKVYEFAVRITYQLARFPLKHWPGTNTNFKFAFRTLANYPVPPITPKIEKLESGYSGVVWASPDSENTPPTFYELQIRNAESGNWTTVYNDSHSKWIIADKYLTGQKYLFRVRANNSRGWGNFSNVSKPFSSQKSTENWAEASVYQFIIIPFIILIVVIILFFTWVVFKKKQSEKKRASHVNDGHNPDVELATLQDLPHIAVQQNNTLYSVSIVPTNADLVALPHFRHDQLIRKKFLGSGAFGEVFEGVCKTLDDTGETRVAVKTLRKCASEHEKEEFLKEALLMSNFKHQHILQLLGVCLDGNPQFIVSELMEGGDLLLFLRHYRPSTRPSNLLQTNHTALTLLDLMKICVHVSRGCKYLEEMHFVHRDLAARNCLVSSKNPHDMVVKIGDFGLARDIYKNDYYRKEGEGLLPVRWMSPESLVDGVFTTQSDIWSFGVLMWEVITYGQQPYPARSNIEVLHYVRTGGILDRPDNCPEYLYQLKLKCWSYAPEDRPSSCFILEQLEMFYQRLLEESTQNKNATKSMITALLEALGAEIGADSAQSEIDGSLDSESEAQDKMVPHTENYLMADIDRGLNRNRNGHKSSIDREFTAGDDPTPLLADEPESTNASGYLEPSKIETPKYLELISDSHTSSPTTEKQSVRGARPKTNSTSSLRKSPTEKSPTNSKKNSNSFTDLNGSGSGKSKSTGAAARRNFQGLHYAQLATCSTDSSVDEDSDEETNNKDINYITPQVSMSCTLLNQLQNDTKQRKLSKQTSAPIPVRNNSLSNDIIWLNNSSIDDQNANNYLFHNSCASPTKLQVWADKNRNLVGKNSSILPISDCPEYINTSQPASLNYPAGRTTGGGAPVFSSQPTLV